MMKKIIILIIMAAAALLFVQAAPAQEYSLGDLYQQALKNSEKIKYAEENLYIAKTGKDKAWSLLMPRVTAYGTYNRFSEDKYNPTGILIQPSESGNWGVRIDESFSLSARELKALKIAGQIITKSEFDLTATRTDFVLAVAASYYDVMKTRKALEIAAANMERLTQYRNSVEKKVKIGELTKTSLLRAEGELSGARSVYLKATNALKTTRAALARATGIEENFRLKETPLPAEDNAQLTSLRADALAGRADLKSYDMNRNMAEEQVGFARGAFWPNVGLFAIYNRADQDPTGATLNRESVLAGVSLTFPFFEGGLRMAELREAKARQRQAQLAYDDFRKSVDIELQASYLDVQTQRGTLNFLKDQLAFAEDNYNAVMRQFDNGLATSLDVMDANSLLLSAGNNVAEALYNYQLAHLKLKKSSGTLLQFVNMSK